MIAIKIDHHGSSSVLPPECLTFEGLGWRLRPTNLCVDRGGCLTINLAGMMPVGNTSRRIEWRETYLDVRRIGISEIAIIHILAHSVQPVKVCR
jgi:hypothetical protein